MVLKLMAFIILVGTMGSLDHDVLKARGIEPVCKDIY